LFLFTKFRYKATRILRVRRH